VRADDDEVGSQLVCVRKDLRDGRAETDSEPNAPLGEYSREAPARSRCSLTRLLQLGTPSRMLAR
jgi:hypothetical protein